MGGWKMKVLCRAVRMAQRLLARGQTVEQAGLEHFGDWLKRQAIEEEAKAAAARARIAAARRLT